MSDELKKLTAKYEVMKIDLKDALTEIEQRGRRIGALEALARGFGDFTSEVFFPRAGAELPPLETQRAKVKRLLIEARSLEVF